MPLEWCNQCGCIDDLPHYLCVFGGQDYGRFLSSDRSIGHRTRFLASTTHPLLAKVAIFVQIDSIVFINAPDQGHLWASYGFRRLSSNLVGLKSRPNNEA